MPDTPDPQRCGKRSTSSLPTRSRSSTRCWRPPRRGWPSTLRPPTRYSKRRKPCVDAAHAGPESVAFMASDEAADLVLALARAHHQRHSGVTWKRIAESGMKRIEWSERII